MNDEIARELLTHALSADGGLSSLGWYLAWNPGATNAVLDGEFTADDLEAIAWWMRRASEKPQET